MYSSVHLYYQLPPFPSGDVLKVKLSSLGFRKRGGISLFESISYTSSIAMVLKEPRFSTSVSSVFVSGIPGLQRNGQASTRG